jgi:uncharacterized protein (TIRG00374 family)
LVWVGLAFSAILLWVVLKNVDVQEIRSAFISIDYKYVVVSGVAIAVGMSLRAIRWRLIAKGPYADHSKFASATYLGVLSNLIFPARAGEVIRILNISDATLFPLSRAVASAMIDRFADIVVLAFSALLVYFHTPAAAILGQWLSILVIAIFVLCAAIALSVWRGELLRDWGGTLLRRVLRKWALRPEIFLAEFFSELKGLVRGTSALKIVTVGIAIWCMDYAVVAFIIMSLGLSLPVEAPLMLWVFLAAGSALPSAPGYVGVYQIAAILALSFYNVASSSAVAVALALQLTTIVAALLMSASALVGLLARKNSCCSSQQPESQAVGARKID